MRITEPDTLKFDRPKLDAYGIRGPLVRELQEKGKLNINGKEIRLEDVSWIRQGDSLAVVIDTRLCQNAFELARNARILLCESTYLEEHHDLAYLHYHMTAKQAAQLAKDAHAEQLVLTHFSARYQNLKSFEIEAKSVFPNTFVAEDLKAFPFPKNPGR